MQTNMKTVHSKFIVLMVSTKTLKINGILKSNVLWKNSNRLKEMEGEHYYCYVSIFKVLDYDDSVL